MKLEVAFSPDLVTLLEQEIKAGERAVTAAMKSAGAELKQDWREQITRAGLGHRLPRTIRNRTYPTSGDSWIGEVKPKVDEIEERIRKLMTAAMVPTPQFAGVRFRGAENKEPNPYAVNAWLMKAKGEAILNETDCDFDADAVGHDFRREVAKLSLYSDGPRRAFLKLNAAGITAVYVPCLKKTHIDGACFSLPSGKPAIALSLRHNRLDNFWFTLLHECVHVERHLSDEGIIIDETEGKTGAFGNEPEMEDEANDLARSALVPSDILEELGRVVENISKRKIQSYAKRADVHEAVIAGQVRLMTGQYTHFAGLIGQGEVAKALGCIRA